MASGPIQAVPTDIEHDKLSREELIALLHGVTEQRDNLLAQYESMALQVDESVREIAADELDAQQSEKKAEASEHRAEQEAAHVAELSSQLDEERRKRAEIADEFARFREAVKHAPVQNPWDVLWRAASQIVSDGVAWARAKIPPDSAFLPWFDRAIELVKALSRLAFKGAKALFDWAKPHVIDLWSRLTSERRRQ
ncbi:MAG: hypothetical protein FJX45_01490 [Alphaproteobacteria bacterium]|nr:hypothetical protein [Alphaproteobacteria bacterium]MBM3652111.1 hypothetical protein [Alphaproteobacteria bacterium]